MSKPRPLISTAEEIAVEVDKSLAGDELGWMLNLGDRSYIQTIKYDYAGEVTRIGPHGLELGGGKVIYNTEPLAVEENRRKIVEDLEFGKAIVQWNRPIRVPWCAIASAIHCGSRPRDEYPNGILGYLCEVNEIVYVQTSKYDFGGRVEAVGAWGMRLAPSSKHVFNTEALGEESVRNRIIHDLDFGENSLSWGAPVVIPWVAVASVIILHSPGQ